MKDKKWNKWCKDNARNIADNSDYCLMSKSDAGVISHALNGSKSNLKILIKYCFFILGLAAVLWCFWYLSTNNYFKSSCHPDLVCGNFSSECSPEIHCPEVADCVCNISCSDIYFYANNS